MAGGGSASAKMFADVQPNTGINLVRNLYLWCMAAVYMFAFGSLYHQIPGLYGDTGILPVRLILKPVSKTFKENFLLKPTLVWLGPTIGLDVQSMVELVALAGLLIAFLTLLVNRLRNAVVFALLWLGYMSLYQIGQTFTWFQWDILLLEAGFLTIFVAPCKLLMSGSVKHYFHDHISMWMVRWLLFRLMFASGVVKLTSLCPTWWGLTALDYHFESQCIPTPLAWYSHHLPDWILRLGVVGTYVIEIPIPLLFFAPVRALRLFSFYAQILLQMAIIWTGNYNFFNLLTMTLCISLLDDRHLLWFTVPSVTNRKNSKQKSSSDWTPWLFSKVVEFAVYGALAYAVVVLFSLRLTPDYTIASKIAFTNEEFRQALQKTLVISIYVGAMSLGVIVVGALYQTLQHAKGTFGSLWAAIKCLFYTGIALWIFTMSMVPHTVVDQALHASVWPEVRKWHDNVEQFQLVSSYGLFRRMTGVDGRPEVIIEGSNTPNGSWKEYHFLYKPGNLSAPPVFVAPHQPRLDWQLWFAALGNYQQNPWFVSFIYRLLTGQKAVLDLMDKKANPFPKEPPKYIRATKYIYGYTTPDGKTEDWWTRKNGVEYFPVVSHDHPPLLEYLQAQNLLVQTKVHDPKVGNPVLKRLLEVTRDCIVDVPAPVFLWSLFAVPLLFNYIGSKLSTIRK